MISVLCGNTPTDRHGTGRPSALVKSEQLCGERWVVVALAQDSSARRATREPLSNLVHSYPRTQMDAWIDAAGTDGPIGSREVLHTPATAVPLAADNPRRRSDDCAFCRQRATCRRHGINMASHQALYYSHIAATHPPTAAGPQTRRRCRLGTQPPRASDLRCGWQADHRLGRPRVQAHRLNLARPELRVPDDGGPQPALACCCARYPRHPGAVSI